MVKFLLLFDFIICVEFFFFCFFDVEEFKWLNFELGDIGVNFWIKCDDCSFGFVFGGNKVCKLEYVFVDVVVNGVDMLVIMGGVQLNYMRQILVVVVKLGMKVSEVFQFYVVFLSKSRC